MRPVVLLSLVWGWSVLLIKVSLGGMTPATVAFGRIVLGAVVILCALIQYRFRRLRPVPVAAAALALFLLGGCGGGGNGGDGQAGGAACGPDREEPLDPRSTQHLLPGAPEPVYSTDPPTSGPHLAGGVPRGAQRQPVPRPAQVSVLEAGGVMIQYRALDGRHRRRVEALAGRDVVVAPDPDLPGDLVATAWRHRLTCDGTGQAEVDALAAFVDAHRGKGPAG